MIIYLACPYSHPDRNVRIARFEAVNLVAGRLMREGHTVFSPISQNHPIAEACELPLGWEYWQNFDVAFLSFAEKLFVLTVDGWGESRGVTAEIQIAKEKGILIEYGNR